MEIYKAELIEDTKPLTKRQKFWIYFGVGVVCLAVLPALAMMVAKPKKKNPRYTIIKKGLLWDTTYEVY